MKSITTHDKEFKEAVGGFIIAFSELEFGVAILCSMTEPNFNPQKANVNPFMKLPFEKKMQHLSKFIRTHYPTLFRIWANIATQVSGLNYYRRFIAHGFLIYGWHTGMVTTQIVKDGSIVSNDLTVEKINAMTDRLHHLTTGENGIRGEFHSMLLAARTSNKRRR